jgi:hypothetical protein
VSSFEDVVFALAIRQGAKGASNSNFVKRKKFGRDLSINRNSFDPRALTPVYLPLSLYKLHQLQPFTMAKDAEEKRIKKEKKDKKEKKEKRAETEGVTKVKKEKKEKKVKDIADALETELEKNPDVSMVSIDVGGDVTMADEDDEEAITELTGALVPFANPLAENAKDVKKILRTVKKCKFISSRAISCASFSARFR